MKTTRQYSTRSWVKSLLPLYLMFFLPFTSRAQDLTVDVSTPYDILPPQVGVYVSKPEDFFTVRVRNNTDETVNIYFGMQIHQTGEGNELVVSTPPDRMPRQGITIPANYTKTLSALEMHNMFQYLQLSEIFVRSDIFTEYNAGSQGLLPEDYYTIRLTAYKWDPTLTSPVDLNNPNDGKCTFRVCYSAQAPTFSKPVFTNHPSDDDPFGDFNVATLSTKDPQIIWQQPLIACSPMGLSFHYDIRIVRLISGQTPDNAVLNNGTVYEKSSLLSNIFTVPTEVLKKFNKNDLYAVQVTAIPTNKKRSDQLGYVYINNDGHSPWRMFRVTDGDVIEDDKKGETTLTLDGEESEKDKKDSLYVFSVPRLTKPTFEKDRARKVFVEEDICPEWRKTWFTGGRGERQDTIKWQYNVQLFKGSTTESYKEIFAKKPVYSKETTELKHTIKWGDIEKLVSEGDYLVLRIEPKCLSKEKSIRIIEDSTNIKDFALTVRYSKMFECKGGEAPKNQTDITADLKAGDIVAIGAYELKLKTVKRDSKSKSFNGTGHINWNPGVFKIAVAVKFDSLWVNTDKAVYRGHCYTYAVEEELNKTNGEFIDQLFSDWGLDHLIGDTGIPFAGDIQESINTDGKDDAKDLAEKIDIKDYYKYYKLGMTAWSDLKNLELTDCHMPLKIPEEYNSSPVDLQIASMTFSATTAYMNLIGLFGLPESDHLDNEILIFGAPRLCVEPDKLLPESGTVALFDNFTVKDPETGFKFTFKAPNDVSNPINGCYLNWQNAKFDVLHAEVEMRIPELKKVEGDKVLDEKPILRLEADIHSWDKWWAKGTMDMFESEDLPGWTFVPGEVGYDHSDDENPSGKLPEGYDFDEKKTGIKGLKEKPLKWQGLFFKEMAVRYPKVIKFDDEKGIDEHSEKGAGTSKAINTKIDYMLIDKKFSASFSVNKIFDASTTSCGGWGISIDKTECVVMQNQFHHAGFSGQFHVPLLKQKNKKGEDEPAKISYKANMYLQDKGSGNGRYPVWVFATSQQADINLDFFLAQATFDKEQTFFFVESEKDTTRVELCLGGKISVSSRIADKLGKATKLGFKLPEMSFTRMRLANCQRWSSKNDKNQAKQYQNWVDEWKAEGREDDRTMVSDDKTVYFDIGKWSGASPQKKLGGFSFTIEKFNLNTSKLGQKEIGLTVGGKLGLLDGKIEASATFSIMAGVDWKKKDLSYKDTYFEEATIDSNFGGMSLKGKLVVSSGDEKGYKGELKFKLPPGGSNEPGLLEFEAAGAYVEKEKTQEEISDELKKKYGASIPANASVDSTYNYCFFEIKAGSKALSSLQPVSVKSIEGGFYWNCRKKDMKVSFSTDNVVAQYGMIGGMLGVGLTCGGENAISANGNMTVFYDMFKDRLSTIKMRADMHAITNDDGTKGLINAEASIVYECTNEKQYFEVDVTVDATADMNDAYEQFVGSDFVKELKKKSETGLSEMGDGEGRNTETSESDKKKQEEKGESSGHLKAGATANVNFKITWKENGTKHNTPLWHLYVGQPSKTEEQDKRCRITFIDFALGKKTDRFAMWATIYADAYLCFGNELPLDDLPPIPKEISEYLGLKQDNLSQGGGDLNAEAKDTRIKQFSTFKPGGNKGGVAFGAKIYGDMGLNLGIIYARSTAIAGFDVMIMKLKKGTRCIGGGEAGKHGWYGMGQVYALLKGEVGLDINMWLFRGKIPLVDVGLGALLQAGMPNPTWVYGKAKAHFKLLGGLIKGSATVQLKAGEVCTPEFGNPLDDIEIFGDVSPGDEDRSTGWNEDNVISASVYPEFNTNMEMDAIFRLLDQNKAYQVASDGEDLEKYTEQASRTYRFRLAEDQCRLALFEPGQAAADKPSPTWDRPVPCKTKNHTIYNVASGTLDYGKLYRLQLSGYAQEFRNGEWGDPFFNDSTTNHKDERKPWSQTKTYYFRTDPTPAPLKDDIMIFHTDYTDDLKRPTFALAHSRWDIDDFGSVDAPVSLRIEVAKKNGSWESPTKILHNEKASQQYNAEKAAYDKAVKDAYNAAMKAYEEGPLAEYYKKKDEAYNQWKNTEYLPWLNENYPGWKDWKFVIKKKYYNEEQSIAKDMVLDNGLRDDIQGKLEKDIMGHLADVAREKGEVGRMKGVLGDLIGETGIKGGGTGILGGGTGILGGGTGGHDPVINTGNNTTIIVGSGSRVTPTNTGINTKVTTTGVNTRVTDTRVNTNVMQTGAGKADIRRFHGPMPDLDIVEANDTIRKVGRLVTTGKGTTGNSDITKKMDDDKDETTYVKLGRKMDDDNDKVIITAFSNVPMYINNVFNPAEGDRNTYKPYITTIVVKSDGSEYKDELKSSQSFFLLGTPYVELTYINTTYVPNYVCIAGKNYSRDGMVSEHEGITQQQWNFLTDKSCPVFTYDVPVPPPPSLADVIASINLPEVSEPDLQRDMDSESFEIPLEEFKVDTDVKDDYIFLRTKKDIDLAPITTLKGRGYEKLRISINRVYKKSYDELIDRIDELALTYSTQKAEKLEGQQMGNKQTKGYDSKQAGKDVVSQDGELNMDAYLTDYIKEMESETVGLDSMAVQRLKHNVDMKDFSTCLYYEDVTLNSIIYDNFEAEYNARSSDRNWKRDFVRTQLQKVEYKMPTNYNNAVMATNKHWKQNPYVSFGYWLKWAMIGGSTLYPRRDAACGQDTRPEFPGLELTLDKPEYRQANKSTYPDGGHLASSAYGKEISDVSQFFAPSMYDANNRSDHHRYTGGFEVRNGAINCITAMIYADCRMAAAISNAPREIVNEYFRGEDAKVTREEVYNRIENIYGAQKIYLKDEYKEDIYTINNKAEFSVRHVPIMIYADYADRVDNTNAKEKFWDEQISLGTVWSGNTCRILQDPAIAWRLDRTIGHQVVSDNELIGKKSQRNGNIEAKSLLGNIKNLKFATYRQNAYHTGFGSGSSVSNYDVCTEQRANGSWYVKKPEIKEFDYNSFDESKLGDYKFEIKDIMK